MHDVAIISSHCYDWAVHGKSAFIGVLPFYHIFGEFYRHICMSLLDNRVSHPGLNNLIHFVPSNGVHVVVLSRFEPVLYLQTIAKYHITALLVVPPILLALLNHPGPCPPSSPTNQTPPYSLNRDRQN